MPDKNISDQPQNANEQRSNDIKGTGPSAPAQPADSRAKPGPAGEGVHETSEPGLDPGSPQAGTKISK